MVSEVFNEVILKTIPQMQAEVVVVEELLGWKGPEVPLNSFGESMMLLTTEVSEAFDAYRNWGLTDHSEVVGRENGDEDTMGNYLKILKPEGVGSELADVLIRLLSSCDQWGVDLVWEYERKMAYNRTRSHRHGGKLL